MPTWSNELPKHGKHMGFQLHRTPQSASLQAIITCPELLVCDTHFWGGRTIPCERHHQELDGTLSAGNCAACNEAVPFRTHVYVSALDTKTRDHFIFECTAHAAKPIEEYRLANNTLRGCIIHASRPKGEKNSKVIIQTSPVNLSRVNLPDPPNVILALTTIWRLPLTGMAIEDQRHKSPTAHTKKGPINRMREQPDNQPDPPTIGEILGGNGQPKRQKAKA